MSYQISLPVFVLLSFSLSLLFPSPAHAYLDPGTGSVILQVVLAGILGAVFTLKSYWRAVKASIGKLFKKSDIKN